MANITDFPATMLNAYAKHTFLAYLSSLPLTDRRKAELCAEWQDMTSSVITIHDAKEYGIDLNV